MREEIEKVARDLISFIVASEDDLFNSEEDCIKAISDAILAQVEKARETALEEAAKIAEEEIYITDNCNELCRMISERIRNKLENQQGE